MRLQDKVSLVTGAAGGIGSAIARVFGREGSRVAVVDINEEGLQETMAEVQRQEGEALLLPADVSRSADVQRAVRETVGRFGRLNVLVNAHGISDLRDVRIVDLDEEVFDRTLAVNLRALFLTCKYALPYLKAAGGGTIVNISSAAALWGGGGTAYTASKGGVNALTRAIAYQYAAEGVRCNVICPGPVDTPMLKSSLQKLGRQHLPPAPGTIPRVARPEEVAYLAAFLASDEAAYITGATYTLDGGSTGY